MLSRKIFSLCLLLICLTVAGCGTGLFDKLADLPGHCRFEPGTEGLLEVTLQCR